MLDELIARIERLQGPDRAVDYTIADMTGDHFRNGGKAPEYTASLDAAMTLVPEGWAVERSGWHRLAPDPYAKFGLWQYRRNAEGEWLHGSDEVRVVGSAPTPALALVLASLKANKAMEASDGD